MKYLIFDSGSLINFTMNGMLDVFQELKKAFPGEFLITKTIKYETIEHPLKIQKYEWGALRINELLKKGVIKLAEDKIVNENELKKEAGKILDAANNMFFAKGRPLHLIDTGEAESLALSKMLSSRNYENLLVIDERTARVFCEKPENLQEILAKKLHTEIKVDKSKLRLFRNFGVIRSTELAYVAYKKGFVKIRNKQALEAIFYALKFGGCSISEREVEMIKKMSRTPG